MDTFVDFDVVTSDLIDRVVTPQGSKAMIELAEYVTGECLGSAFHSNGSFAMQATADTIKSAKPSFQRH